MCGIIGISDSKDAGELLWKGLEQLQHRGQDGAGIATWNGYRFDIRKGRGLADENLHASFAGHMGIGHVRYPTFGKAEDREHVRRNAHPLYVEDPFPIAMAYNGNLVNAPELRRRYSDNPLVRDDRIDTDLKYMLAAFQERVRRADKSDDDTLFDIVGELMDELKGAYSVVLLMKDGGCPKLVAFCDPHKIRPLVYGKSGESWAFASETVALDAINCRDVADVKPGEVVLVGENGMEKAQVRPGKPAHCMFEYVYFARPSSVIEGVSVYRARVELGHSLGSRDAHQIDVVMPVPQSGRGYARGYATARGLPLVDGFDRNTYIPRSFIAPNQRERDNIVGRKFSVIRSEVCGRSIALADDSDVRGTTKRQLVAKLKAAGASAVHNRVGVTIASPCPFGIDMSTSQELMLSRVAKNCSGIEEYEKAVAAHLGADSASWNTPEEIVDAIGVPVCFGCLRRDGSGYPFDVSEIFAHEGDGKRPYEP